MTKLAFKDPRYYQIATLSGLLAYGMSSGAFEVAYIQIGVIIITACAVQWLGSLLIASRVDFKSPIITALSLSLLLRADLLWPLAAAAAIAIGSKFALRLYGKHIFNPANIAIVTVALLTDAAWTTPGQWGTAIWFAALLAFVGMFVTYRSARFDVPLIFLGVYALLIFGRAIWLGDPLTIPILRFQNGALLLFAFFMISDPKTTPDGAVARAAFAALTAAVSFILIYNFHISDGMFYALAGMCLLRPIIEWLNPAPHYQWGDEIKRPEILKSLPQAKRRDPVHTPAE